jgi:hypothetical protein
MFLTGMLVVHLMRPAHCHGVPVVCIPEDFETLMDEDVMYKNKSSRSRKYQCLWRVRPQARRIAKAKETNAVRRIHDKEKVVAFKP